MTAKHKVATESLLARYRQQCQRTAAVEREVGILREQCRHETTDGSKVKELEILIEQLQSASSENVPTRRRSSRRRRKSRYDEDDEEENQGISGDSFRVLEAELDSLRREKKEQLLLKARETQRRMTSERELASTKQTLQELEAKHTATELKLRRMMMMRKKSEMNSSGRRSENLNETMKTMKSELERVEAENKANRKKGLEIVRKLKEWRTEATYWKSKCSKLGVERTPAAVRKSSKENMENSNTPVRVSKASQKVTPIRGGGGTPKTLDTSGISSPIRVDSASFVSTPSTSMTGWSKPLVNLRSGRRTKDTPKSVVMRG